MAFSVQIADLIAADKTGLLTKHESWGRVLLSEVAGILNGAPFDSAKFNTTSGVPLTRIRDIIAGTTSTYYSGEYDDGYLLNQGDLLIGMDGDFNTGYWGSQTALLNQRVCKLTPNVEFYDKALLGYVLPGYLAAINANTPSITVKHLSSKTVGEIALPLPPRAEQARIVEKLEELLSDLDAGVAELKSAKRKLAQYRQSLLKAAVDGALTADWRAAQGAPQETGVELLQRVLSERRSRWEQKQLLKFSEQANTPPIDWRAKYPEPVQVGTNGLAALPEGWAWASVDQAGEVQLGRQRAPQFHSGPNMVPYLRVANVFEDRIDISDVMEMHFSAEDEATFKLGYNDILLNEGQSLELVGRPAIYRDELPKACFTNTLVRFRADTSVTPEFALVVFRYYMHSGRFRKIAKITTNIAHLGAGRFSGLEFPLPPLAEQSEIVQLLANSFEQITLQEKAIEIGLKQSAAQRQNILRTAFAGQLVPQDPNDEPASVLLERIRVERVSRVKHNARKAKETNKEIAAVMSQLVDVLDEAGDWLPAQEAFRRCGVADGALTERIEDLYAELRKLDKAGRLAVEAVTDEQGRKLYDKLKLLAS